VKLWLAVAGPDRATALKAIEAAWVDSLDEESRQAAGDGVIDLEAAEAACPACGHVFDPKAGRCPDCGLFLGGEADSQEADPQEEGSG